MIQLINSVIEFLFSASVGFFLLFFFLPFCINFYGCIKYKRNIFYSFLLSTLYPALVLLANGLAFAIWFGTWMWVSKNYDISTWIGLPLVMIGAFICFWPVGPIWQNVYIFFDNFKYEGIFSFDVMIARKRINKNNGSM
tara:strand:+ start:50 stop:466 length:417 start_codon:yes stop_codon:yes gene_type:complete